MTVPGGGPHRTVSRFWKPRRQRFEELFEMLPGRFRIGIQRHSAAGHHGLKIPIGAFGVETGVMPFVVVDDIGGKKAIHAEDLPMGQCPCRVDRRYGRESTAQVDKHRAGPRPGTILGGDVDIELSVTTGHGKGRDAAAPGAGQNTGHHGGQHAGQKGVEIGGRKAGAFHQAQHAPHEGPGVLWLPGEVDRVGHGGGQALSQVLFDQGIERSGRYRRHGSRLSDRGLRVRSRRHPGGSCGDPAPLRYGCSCGQRHRRCARRGKEKGRRH